MFCVGAPFLTLVCVLCRCSLFSLGLCSAWLALVSTVYTYTFLLLSCQIESRSISENYGRYIVQHQQLSNHAATILEQSKSLRFCARYNPVTTEVSQCDIQADRFPRPRPAAIANSVLAYDIPSVGFLYLVTVFPCMPDDSYC